MRLLLFTSRHSKASSGSQRPALRLASKYSGRSTHNPQATAPRNFSVRFGVAMMKWVAPGAKALGERSSVYLLVCLDAAAAELPNGVDGGVGG